MYVGCVFLFIPPKENPPCDFLDGTGTLPFSQKSFLPFFLGPALWLTPLCTRLFQDDGEYDGCRETQNEFWIFEKKITTNLVVIARLIIVKTWKVHYNFQLSE